MLVLSRKPGQSIVAGEISFKILEVRGNKVLVGIEAPDSVNIRRTELPLTARECEHVNRVLDLARH